MSGRDHDPDLVLDGDAAGDPRLERELRDLLRRRDPGAAPYPLRGRIDRVPEETPLAARDRRGAMLALAGLAAAAAVVVALGPLRRALLPGTAGALPGGATLPPGVTWSYPEMRPIWATGAAEPWVTPAAAWPMAAILVAVSVLLAVALWSPGRSDRTITVRGRAIDLRPRRQLGAWVAVLAMVALHVVTVEPLAINVVGAGGMRALEIAEDPTTGEVLAPHPGQLDALDVAITNHGLLPVDVERPVAWDGDRLPLQPDRFISAQVASHAVAAALPAPSPVTLLPGQTVFARVLVRHLPCDQWGLPTTPVATPWPTLDTAGRQPGPGDGTRVVAREDLRIAATIAGVPRVLDAPTGFSFGMAVPDTCPATEPLPPVDLSTPPADVALATATGSGVYGPDEIRAADPPLVVIVGSLLAASLVVLAIAVPGGRRKRLVALAALAVGAATAWANQPTSLEAGTRHLVGQGGIAGEAGVPDVYRVGPDARFTFGFSVRNPGPVPITIIASPRQTGAATVLGLGRPWGAPTADPAMAVGSWETRVPAGAEVDLLALGRAGSCARTEDAPDAASIVISAIPFTWEALGVRHESTVRLDPPVRLPADSACLAALERGQGGALTASFPAYEGPGILSAEPAPALPVLVVLAIAILGVMVVALRGRRRFLPVAPMALLAGWAGVGLLLPVDIGTFAYGPRTAIREAPNVPGSQEETWYEVAEARQPFSFMLGLDADTPVPVVVEGILDTTHGDPFVGLQWRGLWLSDATGGGIGPVSRPFEPFRLQAGTFRGVYVAGTSSACAAGPSFDAASPTVEGFASRELDLAVTVLGWPRTVRVTMPVNLVEPTGTCGPASPTP